MFDGVNMGTTRRLAGDVLDSGLHAVFAARRPGRVTSKPVAETLEVPLEAIIAALYDSRPWSMANARLRVEAILVGGGGGDV